MKPHTPQSLAWQEGFEAALLWARGSDYGCSANPYLAADQPAATETRIYGRQQRDTALADYEKAATETTLLGTLDTLTSRCAAAHAPQPVLDALARARLGLATAPQGAPCECCGELPGPAR
jgi:hypothetical protein